MLLATSALTVPLASAGVAAVSAYSGVRPRSGMALVAVQPALESHGKVVLDGVSPLFVVAPPLVEGASPADDSGAHAAGEPAVIVRSGTFHTHCLGFVTGSPSGQAFVLSGQWLSNGGPAPWTTAVPVVLPTPPSAVTSVTAAVPKVWWDFFQRRSKFEIYVEILELMKRGPMTPFEVAFYARLNHKRTKEYTEFLTDAGYLQPVSDEGKALCALTQEGAEFLDRVQSLLVGPSVIEVARRSYQRDF